MKPASSASVNQRISLEWGGRLAALAPVEMADPYSIAHHRREAAQG
jgi:hypothetical protein